MLAIARLISILIIAALVLQGCSGRSRVQVDERSLGAASQDKSTSSKAASRSAKSRKKISPVPEFYRVKRGDTLYSIAWRYDLDYRQIAARNRIRKNYQIYPGQRLRLKPAKVETKPVARSTVKTKTVTTGESGKEKLVAAASKETVSQKQQAKSPAKDKAPVSPVTPKVAAKPAAKSTGPLSWRWPTSGRIIAGFKTKGQVNKGLNLAGKKGDPVFASASGEVVYAGSGLLGYGNLIIINHNQKFLSAYAHNSRVFVKESDMVKGGQKIAEIGRSGTSREMLHFEIRRDGVPVNPLQYLPKR